VDQLSIDEDLVSLYQCSFKEVKSGGNLFARTFSPQRGAIVVERRVTRKELLKEPDEFISFSARVMQYTRENPRMVGLCCAVVMVALVVTAGYYAYRQYRLSQSHEFFDKAYRTYRVATLSQEELPGETWDRLFKEFDELATQYPSFPAGEKALLYSGHILYRKGDYQGALERYTRMKSTSLVEKGLGSLVMYHIAMTRQALKDYDGALSLFDQLSKDTNSPYRREAVASMAGIYEAMGKTKEAAQTYRQYLKMFPEAPDAPYIKARIADLSSPG
jgi:tetratricopeptide (TPR) repeat protein